MTGTIAASAPRGGGDAHPALPSESVVMISPDPGVVMAARIVLAHEEPFRIGPLEIRPATRTIARGAAETVVEPRVMQVLVALARAEGVVSRDDLIESCWEGRIVGDDAINRVLSRLRHLEHDLGAGAFRIETITRVGYRLARAEPVADAVTPAALIPPTPRALLDRRTALALGGTGAALAIGGGLWFGLARHDRLPAAARAAMERGRAAIRETTPDQTSVAVAAFRQATELAPDSAEPWGQLALAYQQQFSQSGSGDTDQILIRARAAARHALLLDPGNADAATALATLEPDYGRWLAYDAACKPVLAAHPTHGTLNRLYGSFFGNVGRSREALACFQRASAADPGWPQGEMRLATTFWTLGRLDEADAAVANAFAKWPRHFSVWFTRQRMLTYTGRAAAALAMIADRGARPTGIPEWDFALSEAESRAVLTRSPADIDAASRQLLDVARRAAGLAENAITFHAAVGRIDDAFKLIQAYYFNRGFTIGEQRYSEEQGIYLTRKMRSTYFLWVPQLASVRADPRFAGIVNQLGLDDYWRRSGTRPDYLSTTR